MLTWQCSRAQLAGSISSEFTTGVAARPDRAQAKARARVLETLARIAPGRATVPMWRAMASGTPVARVAPTRSKCPTDPTRTARRASIVARPGVVPGASSRRAARANAHPRLTRGGRQTRAATTPATFSRPARPVRAPVHARGDEGGRLGFRTGRLGSRLASVPARAASNVAPADPPVPPHDWRQTVSVACVMLAVFLHLLGFTVTGPITPGLVRHFSLPPSDVGYLTSAYPLGMFFALFAWPRLSDRVGRKPILVLSLLGVGFGLVAQSVAVARNWSLAAFLGLRVASGAFAGASPVVKAYLADAATPERLADYMAWREAACTLAFIVGPTLGGALFTGASLGACIGVTGWASVAAAGLVLAFVRESRPEEKDGAEEEKDGAEEETGDGDGDSVPSVFASRSPLDDASAGQSARALAAAEAAGAEEARAAPLCPLGTRLVTAVATICVTSFLYNAGQSTFDSFFPLYASRNLGLEPRQIGAWLTALAAVSFTISSTGFARVQKAIGLTLTTALGLTLVSAGLAGIGAARNPATAAMAAATYVAGIPLFTPAVPILLMQCVPPNRRGAVMGLDSAVNAVARICAPIAFGRLAAAGGVGSVAHFYYAAAATATAAVLVLARRYVVMGPYGWRENHSAR